MTIVIAVIVGLLTGVLSGMGIGGGTLLVLYLTTVLNTTPSAAAGINLLYFLGCAPSSLFFHARGNLIDTKAALFAAVGGSITAAVTAWLIPHSSPDWLTRTFGVLLLIVGGTELFKLFHDKKNNG